MMTSPELGGWGIALDGDGPVHTDVEPVALSANEIHERLITENPAVCSNCGRRIYQLDRVPIRQAEKSGVAEVEPMDDGGTDRAVGLGRFLIPARTESRHDEKYRPTHARRRCTGCDDLASTGSLLSKQQLARKACNVSMTLSEYAVAHDREALIEAALARKSASHTGDIGVDADTAAIQTGIEAAIES